MSFEELNVFAIVVADDHKLSFPRRRESRIKVTSYPPLAEVSHRDGGG